MHSLKAKEILDKYNAGTCSEEEKAWIESWYLVHKAGELSEMQLQEIELTKNEMWLAMYPPVVRRMNRWWRVAVAASLILLCAGAFIWFESSRQTPIQLAAQPVTEVSPGTNKAVLTLSDGSKMLLDSAGDKIINQRGAIVLQRGGLLQYADVKDMNVVSYNTLATPRGGRFQLVLQDGTKVWLNAASSIRYPTAFSGKERLVEVAGEAYFEVAQNSKIPFSVKLNNNSSIQVLGTSFNINAYTNEGSVHTTLLEGAVRVIEGTNKIELKPGEQAQVQSGNIAVVKDADLASVMAWKNGLFNFNGKNLAQVMRQLERWYNVDVVYENGVPNVRFFGGMDQSLTLNSVLKILEKSNVHFRMEKGNRLIVLP